jgi:hypothetical protein
MPSIGRKLFESAQSPKSADLFANQIAIDWMA